MLQKHTQPRARGVSGRTPTGCPSRYQIPHVAPGPLQRPPFLREISNAAFCGRPFFAQLPTPLHTLVPGSTPVAGCYAPHVRTVCLWNVWRRASCMCTHLSYWPLALCSTGRGEHRPSSGSATGVRMGRAYVCRAHIKIITSSCGQDCVWGRPTRYMAPGAPGAWGKASRL